MAGDSPTTHQARHWYKHEGMKVSTNVIGWLVWLGWAWLSFRMWQIGIRPRETDPQTVGRRALHIVGGNPVHHDGTVFSRCRARLLSGAATPSLNSQFGEDSSNFRIAG